MKMNLNTLWTILIYGFVIALLTAVMIKWIQPWFSGISFLSTSIFMGISFLGIVFVGLSVLLALMFVPKVWKNKL
jgi:hypothetical protein